MLYKEPQKIAFSLYVVVVLFQLGTAILCAVVRFLLTSTSTGLYGLVVKSTLSLAAVGMG